MSKIKITDVSLHTIDNVNSINDLAKHYDLIRSHARMLFKNDERYEDLVQDLFIKLDKYFAKYPDKIINGGFISNTLRNMIRNIYKSDSIDKIDRNIDLFDDNYEDIISFMDEDSDSIIKSKLEDEEKYDIIEERLKELNWTERTLIEYSLVMNLTDLSKLSGIPYQNIIYTVNKAKKKLGIKK